MALGLKADPTSESKPLASIINGEKLRLGDLRNIGVRDSVQIRDLEQWGRIWPGVKSIPDNRVRVGYKGWGWVRCWVGDLPWGQSSCSNRGSVEEAGPGRAQGRHSPVEAWPWPHWG